MRSQVFISYRRTDAAGWAGRLHDDLDRLLGPMRVFRDVRIEPGADFREHIDGVLDRSDALIAVIGPRWASATGADGRRRLDDPRDLVRREIARALQRSDVHVIPVLVDGARMPDLAELPADLQALRGRNAVELTDSRWDYDVDRLYGHLLARLGERPREDPDARARRPAAAAMTAAAAGAAAVAAGLTTSLSTSRGEVAIDRSAALEDRLPAVAERRGWYAAERAVLWAVVAAAAALAAVLVLRHRGARTAAASPLLAAAAGALAGAAGACAYIALKDLPESAPPEWLMQAASVGITGALVAASLGRALAGAGTSRAQSRLAGLAGGLVAGALTAALTGDLARAPLLAFQAALVAGAVGAALAVPERGFAAVRAPSRHKFHTAG